MGATCREYLVQWQYETEDGELEETWEPYTNLLVPDDEGEMTISALTEKQVVIRLPFPNSTRCYACAHAHGHPHTHALAHCRWH